MNDLIRPSQPRIVFAGAFSSIVESHATYNINVVFTYECPLTVGWSADQIHRLQWSNAMVG